jgi:hypothetical protein
MRAFGARRAPYLGDARPSEVAVVIPHSRLFLGRPEKLLAVKRVVRAVAYDLGVVPKAHPEWTLHPDDAGIAALARHRLLDRSESRSSRRRCGANLGRGRSAKERTCF